MSRSNLPNRPSDYRMPVFMNDVPEDADEEAVEMARRNGVDTPRDPIAEAAAAKAAKAAAKKAAKAAAAKAAEEATGEAADAE